MDTVETELLKATVNEMMAKSVDSVRDGRTAVFILTETVLTKSGQYRGFKFLSVTDGTRKKFY